MATTNQNPIYSFIEETKPKPRTDEKERIKQNLRINAIGQVFNLVAQGIGGSKGATILPTKDYYSPYAMNEFSKMRQEELMGDNMTRNFQFRNLMAEQENDRKDKNRAEDKDFQEKQLGRRLDATAAENEKFRMTPDELKAKAKADHEYNMKEIFARNAASKGNKSGEIDKDLYTIADGDTNYKLSEKNIKSAWGYIMADPEMSAQIKALNPGVYFPATMEGSDPDIGFMLTVIKAMWPKLKDSYGTIESGVPEAKTTTKPVAEKKQETDFTPEQQAKADKIQKVYDSTVAREKKIPLLKAMLMKDWGYSDKEADEYIEKNLPK